MYVSTCCIHIIYGWKIFQRRPNLTQKYFLGFTKGINRINRKKTLKKDKRSCPGTGTWSYLVRSSCRPAPLWRLRCRQSDCDHHVERRCARRCSPTAEQHVRQFEWTECSTLCSRRLCLWLLRVDGETKDRASLHRRLYCYAVALAAFSSWPLSFFAVRSFSCLASSWWSKRANFAVILATSFLLSSSVCSLGFKFFIHLFLLLLLTSSLYSLPRLHFSHQLSVWPQVHQTDPLVAASSFSAWFPAQERV